MSVQALSWILDHSEAEGSERLCLISLGNHAHRDGTNAHPSTTTIGREARVSKSTAKYSLRALEAGGAIERTGVGPNRAVIYRVDMGEAGLAYRTQEHRATQARRHDEGSTVDPSPVGSTVDLLKGQPLTAEGSTCLPVLNKPSETVPLTVTPQPPKGGRPQRPIGGRRRDHVTYYRALAEWMPCAPAPDLAEAWQLAALELRNAVTGSTYQLWLVGLHPHAYADGTLYLGGHASVTTTVRERYGRLIIACARVAIDDDVRAIDVLPCDDPRRHRTERARNSAILTELAQGGAAA